MLPRSEFVRRALFTFFTGPPCLRPPFFFTAAAGTLPICVCVEYLDQIAKRGRESSAGTPACEFAIAMHKTGSQMEWMEGEERRKGKFYCDGNVPRLLRFVCACLLGLLARLPFLTIRKAAGVSE